jgi:hypothetical protein
LCDFSPATFRGSKPAKTGFNEDCGCAWQRSKGREGQETGCSQGQAKMMILTSGRREGKTGDEDSAKVGGSTDELGWMLLAHTCKPNYSGGKDQEDHSSKPAQVDSSEDPISKMPNTKQLILSGSSGSAPA